MIADDDFADPRRVWRRHVQAAMAGDVDAVLSDFTEGSAMVTPDGIFAGLAAIRSYLEGLLGKLDEEAHRSTVFLAEMIHGETLVANFTIRKINRTFYDTALIRDGKFVVLSTVNYPATAAET